MPFGSNTVTYRVLPEKDGVIVLGDHGRPRARKVNVPTAEAPWWWSEYLLAEWKRRNGVEQKRRDTRAGWQRDRDEWVRREGVNMLRGSTGMPRHEVWAERT